MKILFAMGKEILMGRIPKKQEVKQMQEVFKSMGYEASEEQKKREKCVEDFKRKLFSGK